MFRSLSKCCVKRNFVSIRALNSFQNLEKHVHELVFKDVILSNIIYPKTEQLNEKAVLTIEQETPLDWNEIKEKVSTNVDLKATCTQEDVKDYIKYLELYQEEAMLKSLDKFIICKSGLDLLCVNLPVKPKLTRSAYMDIYVTKKILFDYILAKKQKSEEKLLLILLFTPNIFFLSTMLILCSM